MTLLETKKLTIRFGGVAALSDLDMVLNQGEILGLIGPNGAGKTTTFQLLSGYLLPTHGRIIFKGEDVSGYAPHEIAARGLVRTFQKSAVFGDVTVFDNIVTGTHLNFRSAWHEILLRSAGFRAREKEARSWSRELLEFFGLWDKREMPARHLSYGERRLLEIAIALAPKPEVVLLDEPAAGMNPEEAAKLAELIKAVRARGVTVLLVEHHMDVVMSISDRIIVLNHGVKIAEGTPAEVQNNQDVIVAYLGGDTLDA